MIKKLTRFFEGYRLLALVSIFCVLIEVLCDILVPSIIAKVIDQAVGQADVGLAYRYGLQLIVVALFALVTGVLCAYCASKAGQGLASNLRSALFHKIQYFSFADLDKFPESSLITRLTNDVNRIGQVGQMTLRMAWRAPVMFVFAFIMALRVSKSLSMVFIVVIPLLLVVLAFTMKTAFPRFNRWQEEIDAINGNVQETLNNIQNIKSFVREDHRFQSFLTQATALYRAEFKALTLVFNLMPFMNLVMYGTMIAVLWFGGQQIINGQMETGQLFSFILYINQILMSLMFMSMLLAQYTSAKASAKRILEVLETENKMPVKADGLTTLADGSVEFQAVSFCYPSNDKETLHDLNFKIESGSSVALIGATGSGKTSLIQLILRLYDVDAGRVLLAGEDVRDYQLTALTDQVALILQQNTIFSGSLRDNLLWGNAHASDTDLWQALSIAQAADFVEEKGGLDIKVEANGRNFSGGQKQRICIARALLKQPKIMIFDDSLSAVDTTTDRKIRESLAEFAPHMTKITIAQRISSIAQADQILVLDHGRLVGQGTHQELLTTNQIYQEIYQSQHKEALAQ